MKKAHLLLIILLPIYTYARNVSRPVTFITKDSLTNENSNLYRLDANWKFLAADNPAMASLNYIDTGWEVVDPALRLGNEKKSYKAFNGICWYRLHIKIDSSLAGIPLVLRMSHFGASEIFIDGKKVDSFGKINGPVKSEYEDPQYEPFAISLRDTGEHLLAIRYANFHAQRNLTNYKNHFAGLKISIGETNIAIQQHSYHIRFITFIYIFLFGIFVALAMSHFFVYLYYRTTVSNLYFSIFCISIGSGFLVTFFNNESFSPEVQLANVYSALILTASACISMSGLINNLFRKKKLRFYVIAALSLLPLGIWFFDTSLAIMVYFIVVAIVSLEAIVIIAIAIFRKVKGAMIIGSGILFFTLYIFSFMVVSIIFQGFSISENTLIGQIFLVTTAAAILSTPISMSLYLAWSFAGTNKSLALQLDQVKLLSEKTIEQEQEKKRIVENQKEHLEEEVAQRTAEIVMQKEKIEKQHDELKNEKKKSDDLLLNILPEEVADELKRSGSSEARLFNDVTVLFTDFVDFTNAAERMNPKDLVGELHTCFKAFDDIIARHNIEKIKTIGDAYLAVCGLPLPDERHAECVANAALEIISFMNSRKAELHDKTFDIRIGIHSGSVVAGIVGIRKFAYDVWGDTVNTAARMEQNSEPGKINISQTTYELLNSNFICTYRGEIVAKNKGNLKMYFVESLRP